MNPLPVLLFKNNTQRKEHFFQLKSHLSALGFTVELHPQQHLNGNGLVFELTNGPALHANTISVDEPLHAQAARVLHAIPFSFDELPLVTEGESKIIRRLTTALVVEKFKPTVYSFSQNRYGYADGTEVVRAHFSAEIFKRMNELPAGRDTPRNAFITLLERPEGPLIIQKEMQTCNLEVRVKRYHIGSPLHRYRFTENYPSTQSCGPIKRWSRFDEPLVCFDWRHPLVDEHGNRLADEPISDDYAGVWMENIPFAKKMARNTFLWMEKLFKEKGLLLIDICYFIDRTGQFVFGEISPDCMRVREHHPNMDESVIFDKDLWRNGSTSQTLTQHYEEIYERLFQSQSKTVVYATANDD